MARPAVCQTAMSRLCSETQLSSPVGSVSVYLDGLDQVWSFNSLSVQVNSQNYFQALCVAMTMMLMAGQM